MPYVAEENVVLAPDFGMKYLPREVADAKLRTMAEAAKKAARRAGDRGTLLGILLNRVATAASAKCRSGYRPPGSARSRQTGRSPLMVTR
jgi:hypothetical protein